MFFASIFRHLGFHETGCVVEGHGWDVSYGHILRCPVVLGLLFWVLCESGVTSVESFVERKCPWQSTQLRDGVQVCHIGPSMHLTVGDRRPHLAPHFKALCLPEHASESYFPGLPTMQSPKSMKGQPFIQARKEYTWNLSFCLFAFGEVIKTALIISKQPTFPQHS